VALPEKNVPDQGLPSSVYCNHAGLRGQNSDVHICQARDVQPGGKSTLSDRHQQTMHEQLLARQIPIALAIYRQNV
jgi:hypothetical protein